jgi:hypothetical protein
MVHQFTSGFSKIKATPKPIKRLHSGAAFFIMVFAERIEVASDICPAPKNLKSCFQTILSIWKFSGKGPLIFDGPWFQMV